MLQQRFFVVEGGTHGYFDHQPLLSGGQVMTSFKPGGENVKRLRMTQPHKPTNQLAVGLPLSRVTSCTI
jgi:hypothetical protein